MHHLQIKMTKHKREELARKQAAAGKEIVKVRNINGKRKVTGGKDLKSTQQYPSKYGHRVAKLHVEWQESWVPS